MKKPPLTDAEKAYRKRFIKARRYGLTVDQLDALDAMFPTCAVCHRAPLPGKELYVDHDHKTGRVRGKLCFTDNYRLLGRGALGDPARHRAVADYLESKFDARKDL